MVWTEREGRVAAERDDEDLAAILILRPMAALTDEVKLHGNHRGSVAGGLTVAVGLAWCRGQLTKASTMLCEGEAVGE